MSRRYVSAAAVLICLLFFGVFSQAVYGQDASTFNGPVIKEIIIEGNQHLDDSVIAAAIVKTQIGQPAVDELILDDLRSIYDTGYFQDASATKELLDDGSIAVIFNVVENPVVTDIIFRNAGQYAMRDFERQMKTQRGQVLNVLDLMEDLQNLQPWVLENYGRLTRIANLEADTQGQIVIELSDTVLKGINLVGNEKTKDFVIERELTFQPGDPVDLNEIDRSLRRVLMLGYFDEISREFSEEENPDETVLTINLKERKTGSATFGVAFSPQEGLVGFVEAADDNFLGRGQRVNAMLQLGKDMRSYEFGFYEPYIDSGGTSLGVNLYRKHDTIDDKDEEGEPLKIKQTKSGGDLTLGRPFTEFTRGRLTLRAEKAEYDLKHDDVRSRIVGIGVNTNTTDHPLNPTEGYRNDAYVEVGTKLFGGNSQFVKLRLNHSRYFELFDGGYVFAVRGLGGRTLAGDLPESERFRIGGADTLRGYSRGSSDTLQGDNMLVLNAEFRFPIVEKITGVVFTDWGKAWDSGESLNLTDMNNSFGVGVRLDTPLGLLRFDYGLGKNEENKRSGQFYFGIGHTF